MITKYFDRHNKELTGPKKSRKYNTKEVFNDSGELVLCEYRKTGTTKEYEYKAGHLSVCTVKDCLGNVKLKEEYTHDEFGNICSYVKTENGKDVYSESSTYENGKLVEYSDTDGNFEKYTFDESGKEIKCVINDYSRTTEYNSNGHVIREADSNGYEKTCGYDENSKRVFEKTPHYERTLSYLNDNVISDTVKLKNSTIKSTFDSDGSKTVEYTSNHKDSKAIIHYGPHGKPLWFEKDGEKMPISVENHTNVIGLLMLFYNEPEIVKED